MPHKPGPGVPRKFSADMEEAIRIAYAVGGITMAVLAEQNGVSVKTIGRILHPEKRKTAIDRERETRQKRNRPASDAQPAG